MFEKQLAETLARIFKVKKVSYSIPAPKDELSHEQECLFIDCQMSRNTIRDGRAQARVVGTALLFGNAEKMPFGFFSKRIAQADPDDTKNLFFFDFEANVRRYQNIVQRGFSFVYFFDTQYDPDTGSITSVEYTFEFEGDS